MATWQGKRISIHNYPVDSIVQRRNGYIFEKVSTPQGWEWVAQHRLVAAKELKQSPLEEGERVYHIDGDRAHNEKGNLVVLKFNTVHYELRDCKIIRLPERQPVGV